MNQIVWLYPAPSDIEVIVPIKSTSKFILNRCLPTEVVNISGYTWMTQAKINMKDIGPPAVSPYTEGKGQK